MAAASPAAKVAVRRAASPLVEILPLLPSECPCAAGESEAPPEDIAAMDVDRASEEASDQDGRRVTPDSCDPSPTACCDARGVAPDKNDDDPECGWGVSANGMLALEGEE
jgi:hypothetical protein